jgi:hypothetical protein
MTNSIFTPGDKFSWKHYKNVKDRVGTVKQTDWPHVLVQWTNQPTPYWTVEWQLVHRDTVFQSQTGGQR